MNNFENNIDKMVSKIPTTTHNHYCNKNYLRHLFLERNNLIKGSMKLIGEVEFKNLKSNIKIENI